MKKDAHGTIIGTTDKAPYGYGECPVCGHKNVHLAADGRLAKHGSTRLQTGNCPGGGEAPVHVKRSPGSESYLIAFLDKGKRTIDHIVILAPSRNDARRQAIELYIQNGDKAIYAGFVVTEEKAGGY